MAITILTTEKNLIEHSIKGHPAAFKELVVRFSALVHHVIYQKVQDHELTEDLTQEVFVKAYRALKTFDTNRSIKPWLLRITLRTIISHFRKTDVRPKVVSIHALTHQDWVSEAFSEPANRLESKLLCESLQEAILQLEERYRETLYLRYVCDLSYAEIASQKGVPVNTVKTWIRRGKEMLQEEIRGINR
jgi:RNA polymerase sigma-70 factor (ECF subfamily)